MAGTAYTASLDFSNRIDSTDQNNVGNGLGFDRVTFASFTTAPVPEASTTASLGLLLALGLGGIVVGKRRKTSVKEA